MKTSQFTLNKKVPFNWPVVGLLLFMCAVPGLPALYFIAELLMGPPGDGSVHPFVSMHYFSSQLPMIIHGVAGFLFFITIPFQFSPAIRAKHLKWHKTSGKVGVVAAYVLSLSGLWIINFVSVDPSLPKYTGFVATSLGMLVVFSLALIAIKDRKIIQHRALMMRAIAIPLGGVTPLILSIPVMLIYGSFDNLYPGLAQLESDYNRWLGMGINLFVVECILISEKRRAIKERYFSVGRAGVAE